jgi:hypothetical protein
MSKRQRRVDIDTANAVARGVNILGVRGADIAQHYMRHKGVPDTVIQRVLDECAARRRPTPEQAVSEAIMPSRPEDNQ